RRRHTRFSRDWSSDVCSSDLGEAVQDVFRSGLPAPMQAFVFNTRRRPLDDIRVREALILLFEADWINRNLFFGQFRRNDSYFTRSEERRVGKEYSARRSPESD